MAVDVSGSGLRIEDVEGVRTLTLDRVEVRNALTVELRHQLADALVAADADQQVRVIVVTGAGGHFCAGADVNVLDRDWTPAEAAEYASGAAQSTFRALRALRTPSVARVEGAAAGAGMFLALGCDIVVAADDARFVASHLNLGLPPDWGGIWLLPRLVGLARAKALLLTGRALPAARAADWGLIAEAVPAADLDATVAGYCEALAAAPPMPLGLARQGLDRSLDTGLDDFLRWEADAVAESLTAPEHRERVRKFLDARRVKPPPDRLSS
ncbi:MAG TPA: enoyl-CoA hydratase/isomerase family protein [Acidimicrobiia bacterium]|nr:enoyl-CoA hydratase/isomerase family protein [Acidimicrobiia bacterium]